MCVERLYVCQLYVKGFEEMITSTVATLHGYEVSISSVYPHARAWIALAGCR